jgi:RND superfamily putative drug exporter
VLTLARWSTSHRRLVVVLWLLFLAAAVGIWLGLGTRTSNDFHMPSSDSQRARDLLRSQLPAQAGDREQVVFHARSGRLDAPAARREVAALLARLRGIPGIAEVGDPQASPDGTIGFATVLLARGAHDASHTTTRRLVSTARGADSRALQVEVVGPAVEQLSQGHVGSSMAVGLAAAVIVLLLGFGSVLAMGLPILTALGGLGSGLAAVALVSRLVSMADFSGELALMIGLGVGVDYALLVVTRYREAYRTHDGDVAAAVEIAMNTAGRAVIFAAGTVVVSMLGMMVLGISFLNGPAIASSLVVALVLVATLTLLPALLAATGHRIGRLGRIARRVAGGEDENGFWDRWLRLIQRRPWLAAGAATALMLVLASPALGLRLGNVDAGNDRPGTTTRRAYDLLAQGFGPGFSGPLVVVAQLPRPGDTSALDRVAAVLGRTPGVAAVTPPALAPSGDVAALQAFPASSPQSRRTEALVSRLRTTVLPPLERATGARVYVGGFTASQIDFANLIASKLWLFVVAVIAVSALLLLVVFRSLLIPLQAALMNLLSIGASLGVVVAIFQWGWLGGVVGVAGGPIQAFLPVMVFAIVFGLSMDYEVFLVSRIHEAWVHGSSASDAIRLGVARTGRVVTAAAAVMVAVFASFVLSGDRTIELFGLGLASAVFLDAVVIRSVLLPAVLELLGRATWRFPARLDRALPRLALEPPDEEPTPPAPALPSPS